MSTPKPRSRLLPIIVGIAESSPSFLLIPLLNSLCIWAIAVGFQRPYFHGSEAALPKEWEENKCLMRYKNNIYFTMITLGFNTSMFCVHICLMDGWGRNTLIFLPLMMWVQMVLAISCRVRNGYGTCTIFSIYGDPSKLDKPTYCNAKCNYNRRWPQPQGVLEKSFLNVMASDIDFWIQVTKQLGQISGSQTHTTILTTTNENSEIRCCNLVATKAHSQYELTLICVRNSLDLYSLS